MHYILCKDKNWTKKVKNQLSEYEKEGIVSPGTVSEIEEWLNEQTASKNTVTPNKPTNRAEWRKYGKETDGLNGNMNTENLEAHWDEHH